MGDSINKERAEVEKIIKKINRDDLMHMFQAQYSYVIMKKEGYSEKLKKYLQWKLPVKLGDVIKIDSNETNVVTCVYTDNSVDLLDEKGEKRNVGLYGKRVKIVDALKMFIDEVEG